MLTLSPLSDANLADYESLTARQADGGCYCAFWHQKWSSGEAWSCRQKEAPELNRATVLDRMASGFHVGVLAHEEGRLVAWVSVGPTTDFYWTWRRVAQLGEAAPRTAAILCIAVAPHERGKGRLAPLLQALAAYGCGAGWSALEGYPFDRGAIERHGTPLLFAGHPGGFEAAGFAREGAHWKSAGGYERSIWRRQLAD